GLWRAGQLGGCTLADALVLSTWCVVPASGTVTPSPAVANAAEMIPPHNWHRPRLAVPTHNWHRPQLDVPTRRPATNGVVYVVVENRITQPRRHTLSHEVRSFPCLLDFSLRSSSSK